MQQPADEGMRLKQSLFCSLIAYDIAELKFRKFSKQYCNIFDIWMFPQMVVPPKHHQNDHFSRENPRLLGKPTI